MPLKESKKTVKKKPSTPEERAMKKKISGLRKNARMAKAKVMEQYNETKNQTVPYLLYGVTPTKEVKKDKHLPNAKSFDKERDFLNHIEKGGTCQLWNDISKSFDSITPYYGYVKVSPAYVNKMGEDAFVEFFPLINEKNIPKPKAPRKMNVNKVTEELKAPFKTSKGEFRGAMFYVPEKQYFQLSIPAIGVSMETMKQLIETCEKNGLRYSMDAKEVHPTQTEALEKHFGGLVGIKAFNTFRIYSKDKVAISPYEYYKGLPLEEKQELGIYAKWKALEAALEEHPIDISRLTSRESKADQALAIKELNIFNEIDTECLESIVFKADYSIEKAIDEMNKYNPSNLQAVDRPLRKLYKYILLKTIADVYNDAGLNKLTAFDFDDAKVYADNSSSFPFDLKVDDKSDAVTIDFDAMEREIKGVSAICSIELSQLQDFKKKLEQNIPSEWIIEKKSSRPKITDEQFGAMALKDVITKEEITTIRGFFGWSNRGSGWRGTIVRAPNGLIGMIVGDANWGQSRTITVELSNGNRVKFDMNNLGANLKKTQELEYLLEPENQFVKMGY